MFAQHLYECGWCCYVARIGGKILNDKQWKWCKKLFFCQCSSNCLCHWLLKFALYSDILIVWISMNLIIFTITYNLFEWCTLSQYMIIIWNIRRPLFPIQPPIFYMFGLNISTITPPKILTTKKNAPILAVIFVIILIWELDVVDI